MKCCSTLAFLLLIIGGLNWGLVGLFNFDLVAFLFGKGSIISSVVYTLVGLSAIVKLVTWHSCHCSSTSCQK